MTSNERFKELNQARLSKICQVMTSSLPGHLHQDQNMGSSAQQTKVQLDQIAGS